MLNYIFIEYMFSYLKTFTFVDSKSFKSSKKVGPKGPIVRNKNSKGVPTRALPVPHCDVVTERKCPVEGCYSLGHLGGNYEKHFTKEACPLYHNKTPEECKIMGEERKKKEEERKKGIMVRFFFFFSNLVFIL